MKAFAKIALGAVMLAGAATAMSAAPAEARVSVGIGIGLPGAYYGGPAYYPRYSCDPYSRFYDPYYCGAYARPYYYGPDFYLNYRSGWRGWGGGFRDFDRGGFHGGEGFHGGGNFHGGNGGGHGGGHR